MDSSFENGPSRIHSFGLPWNMTWMRGLKQTPLAKRVYFKMAEVPPGASAHSTQTG